MNIEIRKISADEHYLVCDMFDKYRVFYRQPSDRAKSKAFIKDRLEKNESVVFLATDTSSHLPVGFAQLYPRPSSVFCRTDWHLGDLYVEESARKNGIGGKLLRMATAFAKDENANVLTLNTKIDNTAAQSIYVANQFERKEHLEGFYHYKLSLAD